MAQLDCPCGYVHNLDLHPDAAWLTFPDADFEKMTREIVRYHSEYRGGEMQFEFGRLYECPECGRLMLARPGEPAYSVFVPEPRA